MKKSMYEMPQVAKAPNVERKKVIPYRKRTEVWNGIVGEGVDAKLLDDIVNQIASPKNPLYKTSRESGFREKIKAAAVAAINDLLQMDRNFSGPIDVHTNKWDLGIAESDENPNEEIKQRGKDLVGRLIGLAGEKDADWSVKKDTLVDTVVALMIKKETERVEKNRGLKQ